MIDLQNRRPISSRDWRIIQSSAKFLANKNITPNQISVASIFFAALGGLCLAALPTVNDFSALTILCILFALMVLARSLCNLFDGLVAVEGGKRTKSGELFNDIPDRFSDALIFIGAGYACDTFPFGLELGWLAALLSVMTAYVRYVGRALTGTSDFGGPMAKAKRMGVIALATLLTPIEAMFESYGIVLYIALIMIAIGCVFTIWGRIHRAYKIAEGKTL